MIDEFEQLNQLGAGEFAHINGKLIDHLKGTKMQLKKWGARKALANAGLYHAAYGTAGFEANLTADREGIAEIIGKEAEQIVYRYCSCDRDYVWPQFGRNNKIRFKDRFTNHVFELSISETKDFCELTVANELEIAHRNKEFIDAHGKELILLFRNMSSFISEAALRDAVHILSGADADN